MLKLQIKDAKDIANKISEGRRISAMKTLMEITQMNLAEAKTIIDNAMPLEIEDGGHYTLSADNFLYLYNAGLL